MAKDENQSDDEDAYSEVTLPAERIKTENERVSFADILKISKIQKTNGCASPSGGPTEVQLSANPVTEEEIRVFLLQKLPVTTQDLVFKFRARLKTSKEKASFADILKKISKIKNGSRFVVLREIGLSPVLAPKQKDAFKKEPIDISPSETIAGGDDVKVANGTQPAKQIKTENERVSFADTLKKISKIQKTNGCTSPSGGHTEVQSSANPVTEEEIKVFLLQKLPVTTQDLVFKFRARLRTSKEKASFADILKISKIQKKNGSGFVVLREIGLSSLLAPKQKDAFKKEPIDISPSEIIAGGDDVKVANGTQPAKQIKTENELKSSAKDGCTSASKGGGGPKEVQPSAGPITEDEIRATVLQKLPVTIHDLVAKFGARLKKPKEMASFLGIVKKISKKRMTNGYSFLVLRDE